MGLKSLMGAIGAFCRNLVSTSRGSTAGRFSGGPVLGHERISYFVRTEQHIDKKTQCLRPEAFMPRRFGSRLETSVYRTSDLTEQAVWEICQVWYEALAKLTAKGRGDGLGACIMEKAGLQFDPNGDPHPRHADIIGWFDDPALQDREMKHHWMRTARKFAGDFSFKPRPPVGGA
jgi:hypothetical protein